LDVIGRKIGHPSGLTMHGSHPAKKRQDPEAQV